MMLGRLVTSTQMWKSGRESTLHLLPAARCTCMLSQIHAAHWTYKRDIPISDAEWRGLKYEQGEAMGLAETSIVSMQKT